MLLSLDELLVVEDDVDEDGLLSSSCSIADARLLEEDDEAPPPGGGPPGGGPPAPPGPPPGPPPPWPPGPLAKVVVKRFCSSVACELVSAPLETCDWIRSLILDLISPGPLLPLVPEDDWPEVSELLMLVNAEDNADSSDELMAPEDTSD